MKTSLLTLAAALVFVIGTGQAAFAANLPPLPEQATPYGVYLPAVANPPTATPLPTATPTPSPSPTSTQPPTATPEPTEVPLPDAVFLLSDRGYRERTSYYVFAEVKNGRGSEVCSVNLVGKFYDGNGTLVATGEGYGMVDALAPQQRSPVRIIISNAPATIASYTLEIAWSNQCYLHYRNVTVLSQNLRDNYGAEVFGEVRNDNGETLKSVQTVVTFYSVDGRIRYADYSYVSGSSELVSGQTGVYSIRTFEDDLAIFPYTVQAQGYFVNGGN